MIKKSGKDEAMKLYTEADLKKVISIYSEEYKTSTDEILKELNLTPIELPSDEEIWEAEPTESSGDFDLGVMEGFRDGAKWMRNKIQGR
jgi:hypothetical protein